MRVGILGPLTVDGDDGPVDVGGARLRALLIRLAIDVGRTVDSERLADALWGDQPPADQANALQSLVSRLRRVLPDRDVIVSVPTGYRLALPAGNIDVTLFEQLARDGRNALDATDAEGAATLLRRALDLWRGDALADVADAPFAIAAATRLEELRLAAIEDRIEADLALGRHQDVVGELEALAAEHPPREQLRGLQMRALYAAGRQAAALSAYDDTRRQLADQLGVDPSPACNRCTWPCCGPTPVCTPPRPCRRPGATCAPHSPASSGARTTWHASASCWNAPGWSRSWVLVVPARRGSPARPLRRCCNARPTGRSSRTASGSWSSRPSRTPRTSPRPCSDRSLCARNGYRRRLLDRVGLAAARQLRAPHRGRRAACRPSAHPLSRLARPRDQPRTARHLRRGAVPGDLAPPPGPPRDRTRGTDLPRRPAAR